MVLDHAVYRVTLNTKILNKELPLGRIVKSARFLGGWRRIGGVVRRCWQVTTLKGCIFAQISCIYQKYSMLTCLWEYISYSSGWLHRFLCIQPSHLPFPRPVLSYIFNFIHPMVTEDKACREKRHYGRRVGNLGTFRQPEIEGVW